jgi:hypothetical protein
MVSVRGTLIVALVATAWGGLPSIVRAEVVAAHVGETSARVAANFAAVGSVGNMATPHHLRSTRLSDARNLKAGYRCSSLLCPRFVLLGVGF